MAGFLGAAIGELRQFTNKLRAKQDLIDSTIAELTPLIESIDWVGADRDRFIEEWHGVHRPLLARLSADLFDGAAEVGKAIQRQISASGTD